jgi:acyl dehydratase
MKYLITTLLIAHGSWTMAQQVPRVAVTPGSNNAYAAGFSGNRNITPVFATELLRERSNAFDLYDRSNPDVLVGPMPGVGALLAPVTPYLNESFYSRRDR